jgi:hypothetical protein
MSKTTTNWRKRKMWWLRENMIPQLEEEEWRPVMD